MPARPDISFIMAAHNALPYIEEAVASILAQKDVTLELIITDDASTDGTSDFLTQIDDARVVVHSSDISRGPSSARNTSMTMARGQWMAIVDADDVLHPHRSRKLLDLAEAEHADLVADGIATFNEHALPGFRTSEGPLRHIGLTDWIAGNKALGGRRNLGYVKPIFRSEFICSRNIRYDPRIRIGEDYLIILASLAAGANFVLSPQQLYGYRLRAASLSKTLDSDQINLLLSSQRDLLKPQAESDNSIRSLMAHYEKEARALASYQKLKRSLAANDWQMAIDLVTAEPIVMTAIARLALNRLRDRTGL